MKSTLKDKQRPDFTWYFNGRKIKQSDTRFEINNTKKSGAHLKILKPYEVGDGDIRCEATNGIDSVSLEFRHEVDWDPRELLRPYYQNMLNVSQRWTFPATFLLPAGGREDEPFKEIVIPEGYVATLDCTPNSDLFFDGRKGSIEWFKDGKPYVPKYRENGERVSHQICTCKPTIHFLPSC